MKIPNLTIEQLLEAGVHLGHKTLRWNPKMKKYIFGKRDSIHIIDLTQTLELTKVALEKVYNGKNILTILPYPSYNKCAQWWTNKRLEKLYGIAALPFFLRKKKSPSLIIVSKYKPIIEKDSYFLYISKYLIKDENTVLISKSGKHYLCRSNNMINSNDLKLFGILPKHYED